MGLSRTWYTTYRVIQMLMGPIDHVEGEAGLMIGATRSEFRQCSGEFTLSRADQVL